MPWPWIGLAIGAALAAWAVYAALSFRWMIAETGRDRFFGRTLADRLALKEEMRRRARRVAPLLAVAAKLPIKPRVTEVRGVKAPAPACPQKAFEAAVHYTPDSRDIFVVTQMKCGTTWMQQIVYETLCRGNGDLSDEGLRHMYALSPWIESTASVPLESAARVGENDNRIIKTHFPASLCPYDESARYVYVTRHPFTCFASCVDFVRMLAGPFAPTYPDLLDWYCGDDMWWRSWPEHVEGWWRLANERDNVLFLHYEHMLDDLDAAVGEVSAFLGVDLSPHERAEVVRKSDYRYMKQYEEHFEMSPPSLLQPVGNGSSFFQSGKKDRDRSLSDADRARIAAFCRNRLKDGTYPLAEYYPDVAAFS
jgi:hypothetical protein